MQANQRHPGAVATGLRLPVSKAGGQAAGLAVALEIDFAAVRGYSEIARPLEVD